MANWACFVQIRPPEISVSGIYRLGIAVDPHAVGNCKIYPEIAIVVVLAWQDLPYPVDYARDLAPEIIDHIFRYTRYLFVCYLFISYHIIN